MSAFNLPGLQVHFSESKGSGKATATSDEILLYNEKLLGGMRSNTCSDLCPATNANSFQGKKGKIPPDCGSSRGRKTHKHENHTT